MKARFSRSLKVFGFCIAAFLVSVVLIEAARIIEAQLAIDALADTGASYGSSGQYMQSFCGTRMLLDRTVELLKTQNISITTDELLSAGGENLKRCDPPYEYRMAMFDAARHLSILEIIRERTPVIIDARYLKIVICSDHPGFTYDSDSDTCSPQDYPGRLAGYRIRADKVYASVTYEYPLGSSLGLDILKIRLHVFREKKLESFRF
ncbi:MAG: hypothetical protein WA821_03870 [Anaerolineales bacterium]